MKSKFVFIARTQEEIEIFGGKVYIDIDGKNIGIVSEKSITVDVLPGIHKVKMYKSHEYGTMIGFAEVEVNVEEGKGLTFKYTPPMIINQPGNIIVSDFVSYNKINEELEEQSKQLKIEKNQNEKTKKEIEENAQKNNFWIILLVFIIPAIIWIIYEIMIVDIIL